MAETSLEIIAHQVTAGQEGERRAGRGREADDAGPKPAAEQRAGDLSVEHEKQRTETARLHEAVRDLEDKIRQARQKRTLLLARLVRADSTQRINAALSDLAAVPLVDERVVPHPLDSLLAVECRQVPRQDGKQPDQDRGQEDADPSPTG